MKKYILILIASILVSCNFNKIYQNREEDKKDAEKIANKFYSLIQQNNRQEAFKLFGEKFFTITSKGQLNQMIDNINMSCGSNMKTTELISWETFVSIGTNTKSEYVLLYKIHRNIKNTQEKITLQKDNDTIKIVGYNVDLMQ